MANLQLTITPYLKKISGSSNFTATEGQSVKLETSPNGEDVLSETVPAGKVWSCKVWVEIIETDA